MSAIAINSNLLSASFKLNGRHYAYDALKEYAEEVKQSKANYLQALGNFLLDWLNDEKYVIVSTSGSTGKPKQIKLSKAHMYNSAIATGNYFQLPKGTKALLCLSSDYIAGKMMLVRAMVLGWEIDVISPQREAIQTITQEYEFSAMVPLQVKENLNKVSLIRKLIIGGAAVDPELQQQLQQLPTVCYATYGMTETITHIAAKKLQQEQSLYEALPHVNFTIDNRSCLVIAAPNVSNETIITNDIVDLIDNKHFKWLGRYDNVINSGGIKLFPEVIENAISHLIQAPFFVYGIPDNDLGEKLILIIQSEAMTATDTANLLEQIKTKSTLTKYQVPKEIITVPSFVMTPTNKINRSKTIANHLS